MPNPHTFLPGLTSAENTASDHFIVCGLGSLGQQIIINLKKFDFEPFEVNITAIDKLPIQTWEFDALPNVLAAAPIVGDCRREPVLQKAGITQCRAILVVTNDASVNVETAIAARRLNPKVQIILRSSRHSLNQLLANQLGRFVALDPTELPAMTFALAGLGDDTLSVFKIGDYQFRVLERIVESGDLRYDNFPVHQLHRRDSRLLNLKPQQQPQQPIGWATTASSVFHRWQPHVRVQAGDQVAYIEVEAPQGNLHQPKKIKHSLLAKVQQGLEDLVDGDWQRRLLSFWQRDAQRSLLRVGAIAITTASFLWVTSTLLLKLTVTDLSWMRAISLGAILVLGGYGDLFGGFDPVEVPSWMLVACLLISLTSILMVLGIFGLLADQLLSSRFEFLQRRPKLPKKDHVIVVGLGRVGNRITRILKDLQQPLVAITHDLKYPDLLSEVPLLEGDILQELRIANLSQAKSIIAVTNDPMLNLEVALIASEMAARRSPRFTPVIRTFTQTFGDNLSALLPQAKTFSAYALSAEAFAGAAFGENILGLFRLNDQTILVAEYAVEVGDTLERKLLAEIAYGYGVVPILLRNRDIHNQWQDVLMPLDDIRINNGDRLYILSSINGLRRIERGDMTTPRHWQLVAEPPLNREVLLDAGNTLAKLSGVELSRCRAFMEQLPGTMELILYDHQAHRLIQTLSRRLPIRLLPL